MSFLTEPFFPLGDLRWGVVVLGCAFVFWLVHIRPDGFFVRLRRRLSFSGGKEKGVRVLQGSPEHAQPRVIPVKYGRANQNELGGYEGLFLENLGEPAVDVVVHPVEFGARKVTFPGPEIPYLGTGDTRFLAVDVEGPPGHHSMTLFHPFRAWQQDIGDWTRETTGRVTHKDTHGGTHETTYELGVDIRNSDGSMVVRYVGSKPCSSC